MFLAKVHVSLKSSVLDPQGQAALKSLHGLGHNEIKSLRVGRYIELYMDLEDKALAQQKVREYCETLLANLVIETYDFELESLA